MKSTIEINQSNFETEVLKSNQPVLVDFWSEWCGPCKMLAPVLDEIAKEHADHIKVARVNVDNTPCAGATLRHPAAPGRAGVGRMRPLPGGPGRHEGFHAPR